MSDPDFTRSDGLAAMAPTVQIGGRGYVAGRICLAMMFFIPPDGRFSTPPRMVEALARVGRDLPLDLFEFWEQGEPHQSGVIAKQPPLDPAVALDRFMAENKTSVTGTFWGQRWSGKRNGTAPAVQLVSWYYDRVLERDSHRDLDSSNTFQVNIPLPMLDRPDHPQFALRLFADLCDILQPLSAICGLCMATPRDPFILQAQQEKETLLPLLENHPGLLFGSAFDMSAHTRWRMSAVNWLTAIRGDLLALCGGRDGVLRRLDRPGFQTAGYGKGGLLVQAGPSPRIGNLSKGEGLPHYGDLARALRPARLHVDGGRMPHVAYCRAKNYLYYNELMEKVQNRWLARFDAMN